MAVNSTDYSELEDAVKAAIVAAVGIGGTDPYIPVKAISIYNGEMALTPDSLADWCINRHGPHIVISLEGMDADEFNADGGKHPRVTWQSFEVAFYVYDESLRGLGGDDSEATRGRSGKTNAPGIWKMLEDIQGTLSGYVAAISALEWEGPFWQMAKPVAQAKGKQLWRLACTYRGAVANSIDTSGLTAATIHGELDETTSVFDPDVETYPVP